MSFENKFNSNVGDSKHMQGTNTITIQKTTWSQLPDVSKALKTSDEDWFYELRDVLKKHNALDRFGITLLHKHFDVTDDEIMLETADTKRRTLHMRPVRAKEYMERKDALLASTSMKIVDDAQISIQTTMWSQLKDIDSMSKISDNDAQCFRELRDVLKKHNALDIFGIKLLFKQFEVAEDEVLFETTDVQERTQIVRPFKIKDLQGLEDMSLMTTMWKMVEGEKVAYQYCACAERLGEKGHSGQHVKRLR